MTVLLDQQTIFKIDGRVVAIFGAIIGGWEEFACHFK
jgi:hypothetical protein